MTFIGKNHQQTCKKIVFAAGYYDTIIPNVSMKVRITSKVISLEFPVDKGLVE